jgi:ATP-dependent Clp protease ATP-binding subunit ClpA
VSRRRRWLPWASRLWVSAVRSRRSSARASRPRLGHIPFTPRTKKVFELSLREALQLGHNYIGTEHLLLALIREGEGTAAKVLTGLGAELTKVRQRVIELLSGYVTGSEGHVRQLLMRELQALTSQIDSIGKELKRLETARADVVAHLAPTPAEDSQAS